MIGEENGKLIKWEKGGSKFDKIVTSVIANYTFPLIILLLSDSISFYKSLFKILESRIFFSFFSLVPSLHLPGLKWEQLSE